MKASTIKHAVKKYYASRARTQTSCCGPTSCCTTGTADTIGKRVGYSDAELAAVPEGANLGLGCGNPTAIDTLREGEVVFDLGSGAGFDCFLAAQKIGPTGRVIGVDMTPEMIELAGENARKGGYENVLFKLGEIENLPVESESVDVIISNCVINLSTDKARVFAEAFRVLRPGGRLMVSDLVLNHPLPRLVRQSLDAYAGCIAGALLKNDYIALIREAGFDDVKITGEHTYLTDVIEESGTMKKLNRRPGTVASNVTGAADQVVSLKILAAKPD